MFKPVNLSELSDFINKQDIPAIEGEVVEVGERRQGDNWSLQPYVLKQDNVTHSMTVWNDAVSQVFGVGDVIILMESGIDSKKKLKGLVYDVREKDGEVYRTIKVEKGVGNVVLKKADPEVVKSLTPSVVPVEDRVKQYFRVMKLVIEEMNTNMIPLQYEEVVSVTTTMVLGFKEKYGAYAPVIFKDDVPVEPVKQEPVKTPEVFSESPKGETEVVTTWQDYTVNMVKLGKTPEWRQREYYDHALSGTFDTKEKRLTQAFVLAMAAEKGWDTDETKIYQ